MAGTGTRTPKSPPVFTLVSRRLARPDVAVERSTSTSAPWSRPAVSQPHAPASKSAVVPGWVGD